MSYRCIAVGIDLSPESEIAAYRAVEVAQRCGAEVVLIHVTMSPSAEIDGDELGPATQKLHEAMAPQLAAEREKLAEWRQRFAGLVGEVSTAITDGIPASALVEAATSANADLLVVGSHGRTGLRRFLLGSVAERVVRDAPMPVLVARGPRRLRATQHILVPTDFSEQAEHGLSLAMAVARDGDVVDLVHFWHFPPLAQGYYTPQLYNDSIVDLSASIASGAARRMKELAQTHRREGIELTTKVEQAPASHGISDLASQYDLVVVGSRGRSGIERLVLGSVSERVVRHATCSVLVTRGAPNQPMPGL